MELFTRFIDPKKILKKDQIRGELPTTKEVLKKTFSIAWPSALEQLLIALIGAADMIMVGTLGKEAITAVGITNQPKFICLAPILAINIGAVVFVSRKRGEKDNDGAIDYAKIALIASTIATTIICSLFITFSREILMFAGANEDYIDKAIVYHKIITASLIPYSIGLTISSCHRGAGLTKISLVTNLTANIINIIFNYFLIGGHCGFPRLEVKGAAIATAIGNCCSFVIALFTLFRKKNFIHLNLKPIVDIKDKVKNYIVVTANAFVEQILLRIGFFTYVKIVANLGTAEFAAHQACMTIMNITFSIGDGLQIANTSLVGQSFGSKRDDMAIVYTSTTIFVGMCIAFCALTLLNIYKRQIVGIITNDPEVIELAMIPLTILSIVMIFQIPQVIMFGTLRGAKDLKIISRIQFVSVTLVRPILSYLLTYPLGLGLLGAWLGMLTDQGTRFVCSLMRIKSNKWLKQGI